MQPGRGLVKRVRAERMENYGRYNILAGAWCRAGVVTDAELVDVPGVAPRTFASSARAWAVFSLLSDAPACASFDPKRIGNQI